MNERIKTCLTHIAALEAERDEFRDKVNQIYRHFIRLDGETERCHACGANAHYTQPLTHSPNCWVDGIARKAAESQLATRLPDRDGLDEIIRAWVKTLPFNVTEVLKQRHVTKLIDALLSGAATPAPTAALTEEERNLLVFMADTNTALSFKERQRCREITYRLAAKSPPQGAEE